MTFMHRGLRRSLAAGGSAVLALVLVTGCSTTVDGKGVALRAPGSSASSSRTGFPSAPASDTGGAPATGSLTATPDGKGGFLVTYPAGHFKAVFPGQPESQSQPGNLGPVSFTVYIATVQGQALAASEDFSPTIGEGDYDTTLRSAVGSFAGSSGLTLKSQQQTTFQSHRARTAELVNSSGDAFDLVVFMYSGERLYILFGKKGAPYDTLSHTFEALP